MKAYGLSKVLEWTLGLRTFVREGDNGNAVVEIHDSLEPHRLKALQELVEGRGWQVGTNYTNREHSVQLTQINSDEE